MDSNVDWIKEAQQHSTCAAEQCNCKDKCSISHRETIAKHVAHLLVPEDEDYGLNLLHLAAYRIEGGDISHLVTTARSRRQKKERRRRGSGNAHLNAHQSVDESQHGVRSRPSKLNDPIKRATPRIILRNHSTVTTENASTKLSLNEQSIVDPSDTETDDTVGRLVSSSSTSKSPATKPIPKKANSTQSEKQAAEEIQRKGTAAQTPCKQCKKAFEQRMAGGKCKATEQFPVCTFNKSSKRKQCARCTWLKQKCSV